LILAQSTIACGALTDPVIEGGVLIEEICAPMRASVTILNAAAIDLTAILGTAAVLTVHPGVEAPRAIPLVVMEIAATAIDEGHHRYLLELEHPLARLRSRRDHRTFLDKSVQDIVGAVVAIVGIKPDWRAGRGKTPRELCVQYGETDFDFIARLLEEEGVFWLCSDDASAAKMLVADLQSAFTPIAGLPDVPLSGRGVDERVGILDLQLEHSVTSGAVALADYDFEKPGVDLTSRAKLDDSPAGEIFEYPGRYTTQSDGAALAKVRSEELASMKVLATGTSTRAHLRAGAWFNLTSEADDAPTGKYLLRRVEHDLSPTNYENRFVASPFDLPFRPRRKTPRPIVAGALTATVTGPANQEIHTDKLGRAKVLYAYDRLGKNDDTSSPWIRVAQPMEGGSMMLARVGWETTVVHLDGDPDRPIVLARMYDGEHRPPETLPGMQTKTSFETMNSPGAKKLNAITINDKKGAMVFDVIAAKDLDATILHDETETIGANDTLAVGKDSTTLIGDAQTITVDKDETATINKNAGVAVAGDRKKSVTKNETATVDAGLSVRIDGNDDETVGKDLTITSDEQMLERTKGAYALTVGGSVTAKSKQDYTLYVAGKSAETVGGAKSVASSDGSLTEAVSGDVSLTIGGAWVETVEGNCVSSAQGDLDRTVGGVGALTATGKLQLKAKTIKITVAGAVTLLGGGGVVNMSPASVALVGMITLKGSGGVEIAGNPQMVG
jgi:type VI secretion system secreted protein VgrG